LARKTGMGWCPCYARRNHCQGKTLILLKFVDQTLIWVEIFYVILRREGFKTLEEGKFSDLKKT
jgi:hypothetical protein